MLKNKGFLALILVVGLSVAGCSLPSAVNIGKVEGVNVTTVVQSQPLSIGEGGSASVTTDDFTREQGKKLNSSGQVVPGEPTDSVLTYSVQDVILPDNITGSAKGTANSKGITVVNELGVEGVSFNVDLGSLQSVTFALTVSADGITPITLVRTIVNGANTITLTDAEQQALSNLIESSNSIDITLAADGSLTTFSLDTLRLKVYISEHTANS